MKIIYEQGDIVYNSNNYSYGIVIDEYSNENVKILECGKDGVFTNCPPKSALKYYGHTDFKKRLRDMLVNFIEKGGE